MGGDAWRRGGGGGVKVGFLRWGGLRWGEGEGEGEGG